MKQMQEIPREIVGGCHSQLVIHIIINKKLIADISNQSKTPHTIVSADASNYFDHIAHPITSMACHRFGLPLSYLIILFKTIQSMNMFLTTAHKLSTTSYSGTEEHPFQEMI